MTIQEHFDAYLKDFINLRDKDIKKIKVHTELREKLEVLLSFKGEGETYSFLTGSYVRNTIIRPPKDVDFFIVLDETKYGNIGPKDILSTLEKAIKDVLKDKRIVVQSHSVTIEYDNEFGIDVIPAFENGSDRYKIPEVINDKEAWLLSNPKIHKEKLTKANESNNGQLVPIVKLLKSWKEDNCAYLKSFHLELLAARILDNAGIRNISEGLNIFFNGASSYLSTACVVDPANTTNLVDSYLNANERSQAINSILKAKEISNKAWELEAKDDIDGSIKEWNKLFGKMKDEDKILAINIIGRDHDSPKPYCNATEK